MVPTLSCLWPCTGGVLISCCTSHLQVPDLTPHTYKCLTKRLTHEWFLPETIVTQSRPQGLTHEWCPVLPLTPWGVSKYCCTSHLPPASDDSNTILAPGPHPGVEPTLSCPWPLNWCSHIQIHITLSKGLVLAPICNAQCQAFKYLTRNYLFCVFFGT